MVLDTEMPPHKRRRYRAIRQAAAELVRERGYEAMTYDAVAERAGVSRRTVFNYFPTKFDLIKVWPTLDPEAFAHIATTSNNFLADLRELLLERARRLDGDRAEFLLLREIAATDPEVHNRIDAAIRNSFESLRPALAQRAQLSEDDSRLRLAVYLMLAIERAAFDEWLESDTASSATLEDAIDHTLALTVSLIGSGLDDVAPPTSAVSRPTNPQGGATPATPPSLTTPAATSAPPQSAVVAPKNSQGKEGK